MEFVPNHAPYVVLAFLMTGLVGFVGTVLLAGTVWMRRWEWVRRIVVTLTLLTGLYGGALLAASVASSEKLLRTGERKYFCEIDCHLAYSITSVQTMKTLGSGDKQATAAGTFYVVTLRTYFDEKTISPNRGNGPLHPNLRLVQVVDGQGAWLAASLQGMKALDAPAEKMVSLDQSLRPGESYETTLVFDLPPSHARPAAVADRSGTRKLAAHRA